MLLTIHILLLFSFFIHASPLSGARGKYGSLKRKSWPSNSLITPSNVKRENSDNTNLDDAHSPDIKPSVTSSSPSSTSNSPNSTSSSPSSGPSDSALNDENFDVDEDEDEDEDDSTKDEDSSNDDHNANIDDSVNDGKVSDTQDQKPEEETSNHASLGVADIKGASSKDATSSKDQSSKDPGSKGLSKGTQSIIRASFTSNPKCGQTISCNAGKTNDHTGVPGIGAAAVNGMLFGGPPGIYDGSGGYTNTNGLGAACGSCWTLTPGYNYYESNGQSLGTTVVVRINDACTDPGYCDQQPGHPLNTGPTDGMQASGKFDAPVHFDLCEATGVAAAFFGEIKTGVAIGAARYNPDCVGLEDGAFGAKTVGKLAMPF
ncbi:MAG: hypothetical protein L6R36_000193 [Xanthoria steineri]|nr:MAG: hypothetical protein L6R36_000193 [Xanthoria steineri]